MRSTDAQLVRDRITSGMNVRIAPLATCAGTSITAIRLAIDRGDVKAIRLGRAILIPAQEAAKLLGMAAAAPDAQAAA